MGDLGLGWGGLVDWGSGLVGWSGGGAEASLVVGVVSADLDTAVRKVHTVGSVNLAIGVLVLCLLEGGAGILVLDTVLVSVWLRGELLHWFVVGGGGVVGDRGRLVG